MRPAAEILATLDDEGCLEGVPFMPEMLAYIGRRFTTTARVERACDTINKGGGRVRRMPRTVALDDLRCDGAAHGGCGAGCRLYWKEDWLRAVQAGDPSAPLEESHDTLEGLVRRNTDRVESGKHVYHCQATEFVRATEELGWWDTRSFFREVSSGNVSLPRFVAVCARIVIEEIGRRMGIWSYPVKPAAVGTEPSVTLNLQPGDSVQIRSQREIAGTLDEGGRTRGLWFDREMLPYCGDTHTVKRRVNRFIDEGTGQMIELTTDCVILDDVVCRGHLSEGRWFCSRAIYPWWREAWLRRADEPASGDSFQTEPRSPTR